MIAYLVREVKRILNCSKEDGELGKRKKIFDKELLQIP